MFVSSVALAQGTSVITGTVTDAATGKPVPDVVVTATSPALQGEQVVVTDSVGLYRIPQLPSGVYTIKLEKESYKPYSRDEITIRTDRTVRVNVQVQPEAVQSEQIVVVARPPTVDVGSTTTGINVGKEFINNIAFVRPSASGVRSFESLASVAPQVTSDNYGFGFSGAQSPENQVLLDGVSVTDVSLGTVGAQLPIDFIQEANIITGAYQAEYGRAGGGVINAVTKSGSNEFHGSVFANYTPGLLSPASPEVPIRGVSNVQQRKNWNVIDFGAELGGPIIKDRLWFYVGASPSFNRQMVSQYLNRYNVISLEDGTEEYETDGSGNYTTTKVDGSEKRIFDDRRSLSYIAKLTFLLNSDNNISLSVSGNDSYRNVPSFRREAGTLLPQSSLTASLKYAGAFLDKHLLVDISGGWARQTGTNGFGLPNDGSTIGSTFGAASIPRLELSQTSPPISIVDVQDFSAQAIAECRAHDGAQLPSCPATGPGRRYPVGGFGPMRIITNDTINARASVTYLLTALGHHLFKAGVDFDRRAYGIIKAESGGVRSRQSDGTEDGFIGYLDYRNYAYLKGVDDVVTLPKVVVTPTTNQLGLYLQDSWSIMDYVTLNAGVRYDSQTLYNGAGTLGMALNNMWSPRIGLIYDFTNQGRSKLYANYSRYYSSLPLDLADRSLSGEFQTTIDRAGRCNPKTADGTWDPSLLTTGECANAANYAPAHLDNPNSQITNPNRFATPTGSGKTAIDPNLQPESKDEVVVGAEYEIITDLRLGLSYTHSWMNRVIEDMSNDEARTYFIGNPGFGIASDFPKAVRDYDAGTLQLTKAWSDGWMTQVSYTLSYLRGNWAGFYRPETGQLDPGINSDFDLKSLVYKENIGPLPGDRTHVVKVYAAKEFLIANRVSLQLGVTYEGSSGTPISYLGGHPLYGDGEAFILPRGAAGRTPWVHIFNVRAGVGYRVDKDLGVQFSIDGLNVFNLAAVTNVDQNYTTAAVLPYIAEKGENAQRAICADGSAGCVSKVPLATGGTLAPEDINPNFKQPSLNGLVSSAYQLPMQWRFNIKFTF